MSISSKDMPLTYSTGWIYVLENEWMPNLFKIGFTKKTVEERVAELSNHTGVPSPFTCVFYARVRNPEAVEGSVHETLDSDRANKEFFKTKFELVVTTIRQKASEQNAKLSNEWTHSKYSDDNQGPQTSPNVLAGYPKRCSESSLSRIAPGQLTPVVVREGAASASLEWVPLKGHLHEK